MVAVLTHLAVRADDWAGATAHYQDLRIFLDRPAEITGDRSGMRVLVVGEAKRGKSTLVNALMGHHVLPSGMTPLGAEAANLIDQAPTDQLLNRVLHYEQGSPIIAVRYDLETARIVIVNFTSVALTATDFRIAESVSTSEDLGAYHSWIGWRVSQTIYDAFPMTIRIFRDRWLIGGSEANLPAMDLRNVNYDEVLRKFHDDLVNRSLASLGEEAAAGAAERRKNRLKAAIARLKTDATEMARIDAIAADTSIEDLTDEPDAATSIAPRSRWLRLASRSPQGEDLTDDADAATSIALRSTWLRSAFRVPQGGAAAVCVETEPLLTPAEVATMFRVDPKTVTRWAKAGKLTSIRTLAGHRRYRETEVRALLAGIPQNRSE